MTTLSSPDTPETARGWETVTELRGLLAGIGADEGVLARILLRSDMTGAHYVSLPPLPEALVARLTRLLPAREPAAAPSTGAAYGGAIPEPRTCGLCSRETTDWVIEVADEDCPEIVWCRDPEGCMEARGQADAARLATEGQQTPA